MIPPEPDTPPPRNDPAPAKSRSNGRSKDTGRDSADDGGPQMTFWEHLDELRRRLIWSVASFAGGCLVAWGWREPILDVIARPFLDSWLAQNLAGPPTLHFDAPTALFLSYVKLSMLGGVLLAAPVIFYQVWGFIAPGLYAREKRFVIPFVLLSTSLFAGGGFFGWKVAFPIAFKYFLGMSGAVGDHGITITPTVMIGEYLDFVTQMLLGFAAIFEIPVFVLFLSVAGVVNYLHLISFGRWFILAAFVLAAVLTPPDVTSQLLMAIPMCILYFGSIGLAYLFGKKPSAEQIALFRARRAKK